MKKISLILASCMMLLASCNGNSDKIDTDKPVESESVELFSSTYTNPLMVLTASGSPMNGEIADPSVVRDPDTGKFYCFSTNRVILESEDGCAWTVIAQGENVINAPTWGASVQPGKSLGLWAPDVVKIKDTWYYFYSLSGWGSPAGVGYGIADNIAGPYTDMGELFNINSIGIRNAIDPQVFVDDDGRIYCSVGSFQGIYLVELEQAEDGSISCKGGVDRQNSEKVLIAGKPSTNWDGGQYEGSYIIKKDGYYYYFGSSGSCCEGKSSTYQDRVGRSDKITGPYRGSDNIPLTLSGSASTYGDLVLWAGVGNEDLAGPGHNSIVVDDAGDYWIYYHSYSSKDSFGTRHLFMDKLIWDEKTNMPHVDKMKPTFDEEKDGPKIK